MGVRAPAKSGYPTTPDFNGSSVLYNGRVWFVLLFLDSLLANMATVHPEESAKMQSDLLFQI